MKYLAAYTLLVLSGNKAPSADDLAKLLKEVGATADKDSITNLLNALKGKQLHELVQAGTPKLASVSSGVAAPVETQAAPEKGGKKAKEEKPKEEEVQADVDMGGLFGGDDY